MTNENKAKAWDEGYKAGREAGGSKVIPVNPHEGTEGEMAFFEGYGVGLSDAWKCVKTGQMFDNPYRKL